MARERWRAAALGALLLAAPACRLAPQAPIQAVTVAPDRFEIRIRGDGELQAAQATPIQVPPGLMGAQRLAWLAEDGAEVAQGDRLALLDEESVVKQIERAEEALERIEYQLSAKQRELDKERHSLDSAIKLLESERRDAERFAPRDPELYSRIEIIESQIDLELIDTKIEHFRARTERYSKRAEAEMQILQLQQQTERVRLEQYAQARDDLNVRAPHPGFFLRGSTWEGERMRVGLSVWRGQQLGELPDVSQMEAKLWVLESEAAGLAEGLRAEIVLDAHPDRIYGGAVKSVQPVANPIERDSPVKYFEVLITLDETDTERMKPAARVRGTVFVAERDGVLSVPNQAIFQDGEQTWLYVDDGDGFARRPVSLGERSVSRTVIVDGLQAGERVALVDPQPGGAA